MSTNFLYASQFFILGFLFHAIMEQIYKGVPIKDLLFPIAVFLICCIFVVIVLVVDHKENKSEGD